MKRLKKYLFLPLIGLGIGGLLLGISLWLFPKRDQLSQISVRVVEVEKAAKATWSVPRTAVAMKSGQPGPYVVRLKHLRPEPLRVMISGETASHLLVQSDELRSGDLLVLDPSTVPLSQAVVSPVGLGEERLIRMTLEAGMAAAMAEDLDESMRFISPHYRDTLGFNIILMRRLLERAYASFDAPLIQLATTPAIQIKGGRALIQAQIRLTAVYQGSRNYLLGDTESFNTILLVLDKFDNGWKLSSIEGLRPLGFEERFLKLLAAELGVVLTEAEQVEKQQFCMSCRQTMDERFDLGLDDR